MDIINLIWSLFIVTILLLGYASLKLMDTRNELRSLQRMSDTLISTYVTLRTRVEELERLYAEEVPEEHESEDDDYPESDNSNLSVKEHILLREEAFNRRIEAMKEDAPILHKDVHNIPHRVVELKDLSLPDVEETE